MAAMVALVATSAAAGHHFLSPRSPKWSDFEKRMFGCQCDFGFDFDFGHDYDYDCPFLNNAKSVSIALLARTGAY